MQLTDIQLVLGIVGAIGGGACAAALWLARSAYLLGQQMHSLESAIKQLESHQEVVKQVPTLIHRVGAVEDFSLRTHETLLHFLQERGHQ